MKNTFIIFIIISSFYLPITAMELARTSSLNDEPYDQTFRFIPKKIDWISEEKQKVILTTLLSLQKSNRLINDLSNGITYKLFTLYAEDEYQSLKKMCPLYLGNQKYDIEQISLMPFSDRKKLILYTTPNFSQQIKGSDNQMLLKCEYDELIEILPINMRNNFVKRTPWQINLLR